MYCKDYNGLQARTFHKDPLISSHLIHLSLSLSLSPRVGLALSLPQRGALNIVTDEPSATPTHTKPMVRRTQPPARGGRGLQKAVFARCLGHACGSTRYHFHESRGNWNHCIYTLLSLLLSLSVSLSLSLSLILGRSSHLVALFLAAPNRWLPLLCSKLYQTGSADPLAETSKSHRPSWARDPKKMHQKTNIIQGIKKKTKMNQ